MSAELPEEIIDMILAALAGDTSSGNPANGSQVQHRQEAKLALSACSLVCKRWNNITLPHLFRSIVIVAHGKSLRPRAQYFARTPQIATHVQELYIVDHETDAYQLDMLLQAHRSLRNLDLKDVCVQHHSVTATPSTPRLSDDYIIEKLRFEDNSLQPFYLCASIVNLLSLYAEIGELCVEVYDSEETDDRWPTEDEVKSFVESSIIGHTQIRKLQCGGQWIGGFFTPSYLLKTGALDHLTHLTFRLLDTSKWEAFFDLVSATRSTLIGLRIEIVSFTERGADHDVAAMKDALATCDLLEELSMILSLEHATGIHKYIRHPDGKRLCYSFGGHEASWLAAVRILGSVPTTCLRKVTLGLQGTLIDAHILAWDQFRAWCSGAPRLAEVTVELEQAFDQRPCLAYEMRDFKDIFTPTFIVPLGYSLVISVPHPGYQICTYHDCTHDSCRRFQAEQNARA